MSVALATGLYATHTLVPPTPGPIAAAGNIGAENYLGTIILIGLLVAIPAVIVGYLWAVKVASKIEVPEDTEEGGLNYEEIVEVIRRNAFYFQSHSYRLFCQLF